MVVFGTTPAIYHEAAPWPIGCAGAKRCQQKAPFRGLFAASALVARRQIAALAPGLAAARMRSTFCSSAMPASKAASSVRRGLQSS
jgi:hypothetical protein